MMRRGEINGTNSSRCEDCGNQAKKDCEHMRCRTCCKNRRFHCETHIKSTWIPVSQRRPRHLTMHQHHQISQHHQQNPKRYRENSHPLGLQEGNFPGEVSFPAVFRCVKVSSADNVVDQYAYQTSVSIGGRRFTGILYDHGPEPEETVNYVTGGSSSDRLLQQPNFLNSTTSTAAGTTSSRYHHLNPFSTFNNTASQLFQYPKS